jgi:hypothetical protein
MDFLGSLSGVVIFSFFQDINTVDFKAEYLLSWLYKLLIVMMQVQGRKGHRRLQQNPTMFHCVLRI